MNSEERFRQFVKSTKPGDEVHGVTKDGKRVKGFLVAVDVDARSAKLNVGMNVPNVEFRDAEWEPEPETTTKAEEPSE